MLFVTTASGSNGTLGGLVSLSEPNRPVDILHQVLHAMTHCPSDPVCVRRVPKEPGDFLHGAVCHCYTMVLEASCERANRFSDRRFVIPLLGTGGGTGTVTGSNRGLAFSLDCRSRQGNLMEPTDEPEPLNPLCALGAFLTGSEANGIAARLAGGATLSQALVVVPTSRRSRARKLLSAAGLRPQAREHSAAVLRVVVGAASRIKDVAPVWTVPAGAVGGGALTVDAFVLVGGANTLVVCAAYNLQPISALWAALMDLRARRPGVSVRLYLDTQVADGPFCRPEERRGHQEQNHDRGSSFRLSTGEITQRLRDAVVMCTRAPKDDGRVVTSHAKFLSTDHCLLLVGSANFSYSAEERNVELGPRLDDPALVHSAERQMHDLEETAYELVR